MIKKHLKKLVIIAALITIGTVMQIAGFFDAEKMIVVVRGYADQWWLAYVLVLIQVVLFTFALAGSLVFWLTAPFFPPSTAAFILALGATLGGVGAYFFSKYLTDEWSKKIERSHAYKVLHKQDNFFMLFAMRIFPAFPQSVVNYSSGVLNVKLTHFIPAAFLGVGIKSYIYSDIVYNLTTTASVDDLLNFSTIAPLVVLSVITFIGVYINYKMTDKNKGA